MKRMSEEQFEESVTVNMLDRPLEQIQSDIWHTRARAIQEAQRARESEMKLCRMLKQAAEMIAVLDLAERMPQTLERMRDLVASVEGVDARAEAA